MYIQFKNIKIKGFQSLKSAEIDFDNQGIVLVKGINEYENNADSNGSGKSSCFESVCWALFGKTSNGINNVANRYIDSGCCVTLEYSVNDNSFKIIRSIKDKEYGTGVKFFCNDKDISCKNKTDTDKLIKENFPFDDDIFLTTIFLSQGFNLRLGVLSPSGRKERIETLTGLENRVDKFKDYLSTVKNDLNNKVNTAYSEIQYNVGAKNTILSQISNLQNKIDSTPNVNVDYAKIENELTLINDKLSKLNIDRDSIYKSNSVEQKEYSQCIHEKNSSEKEILDLHKKLEKLSTHFCPTCNSELGIEKVKELTDQYNESIKVNKQTYLQALEKEKELKSVIENSKKKLDNLNNEISQLNLKSNDLRKQMNSANEFKAIGGIKTQITELKAKLTDIELEINNTTNKHEKLLSYYEIANHCLSLVSKQFRTYLLGNVIDYMNSELLKYSAMMFSNADDVVRLEIDGNKLNICLGNALYETLSGGEKRKIDIILTFVQRDMLLNIVGISSNLIILDEIMDFMDEAATDSTLKMIMKISNTLSSMFIISHNNYDIPFDKTIKVIKNEKRCSTIEVG